MLIVIDAGIGNTASVVNMLRRIGQPVELRQDPTGLGAEDKYVLPGVGSFDAGAAALRRSGWFLHLSELPQETHILGICLGMQLLSQGSEEGAAPGIGRVPARFERLVVPGKPVPHMGWSVLTHFDDSLFDEELAPLRYYFAHSYHANCDDPRTVTATANYGTDFTAAYRTANTRGVQFHPEKSHKFGMSVLKEFAAL